MQVLDEEPNQKAANLMRLALYTGMRRGELFRLKWADIDWERGFISLTGDQSGGYDTGPKGGKNKKIPLTEPAAEVLQRVMEAAGGDIGPYVFPGRDGKGQLTDIRRQVRRIKEKAGLPDDFRPLHGLRHTFASSLASSGEVDMYTLQKLMTHSSPQMTERYAHLRDEAMQKAGQVVCKLFKRRTSNSVE
jgi:integrase